MGIYQFNIKNENHADHLQQAYGFLPDRATSDQIVYPVGVEDFDYSGWSTFHYAAYSNDVAVLKDIINQDGFSHLECTTQHMIDGHGYTPLMCCCRGNATETFDILVSFGADITVRDKQDMGILEITILSRSVELFEHMLEHGYEFNDLKIWQSLMSMLYRRGIDEGREMRYNAMQVADELVYKDKNYVAAFITNGGFSAILDILGECLGLSSSKKGETVTDLKSVIQAEEADKRARLYIRTLQTLYGIITRLNDVQGLVLCQNYKNIILSLVQLMSEGSEEERRISGECLKSLASYQKWGVKALLETNTLTSLLRSVLLDLSTSQPFFIIQTSFNTEKYLFLENIKQIEVEVIVSILKCEKRQDIKKFFVCMLTEYFKDEKVKHHLYGDDVIEMLLSGLDSPDSVYNSQSLQLLLNISMTVPGLQSIFRSTNSFLYLVNRVLFETEDRFDMCCKLLWKLIHSCRDVQSSVRIVENIGLNTVVRMLASEDDSIKCIGGECIKILLQSDKYDYHTDLIRKEAHTILISMLQVHSGGHVLYSAMSALSELCIAWSSFHPVPVVQNTMLQLDCLERILQIAQSSKFVSPELQSAAFRLIAAMQLGNSLTEKRLADSDVDICHEIRQQTRHDPESEKDAITALCLFKTHDLLVGQSTYKNTKLTKYHTEHPISLLHNILDSLCKGDKNEELIEKLLDSSICEENFKHIATIFKFKPSCETIVQLNGIPKLIYALYEGTPRIQESAASALASITNYEVEEMLLYHHEDNKLVPLIQELSVNIPVSEEFLRLTKSNTLLEHRRRQLKKTSRFLPEINRNSGTNTIFGKYSHGSSKNKERNKTPTPGDKTFQKMHTVEYKEISELGLTRPYSKIKTLPAILTTNAEDKKHSPHDKSLFATVDRVYKKLYLRPMNEPGKGKQASVPVINSQELARSLSFVF